MRNRHSRRTRFFAADVNVEKLRQAPALEFVDLQSNPLPSRVHDLLSSLTGIRIELSPRQVEDWENLYV